jgi:hypothetical protein
MNTFAKNKYKKRHLSLMIAMGLLLSSPSQAIELLQADEDLKIPLSVELRKINTQHLFFKLDNTDVTTLVNFTQDAAHINPNKVLSQGVHKLIIYRIFDGQLSAIEQYDFRVEKAQTSNYLSDVEIETSLNASTTLSSSEQQTNSEKWTLDGSSAITSQWKGNTWEVDTQASLFFDKNNAANNQPMIDLSDYLINFKRDKLSSQLGHHQIESDSLILRDFHRRGLSMQWQSEQQDKTFTAFAFNSESTTGFRKILGITDKDSRVIGSQLKIKPFEQNQDTEFTITNLTGKNTQQNTLINQDYAWSIAAKSQYLDKKITVQGEIAHSSLEIASQNTPQKKTGRAYQFSVVYNALQNNDATLKNSSGEELRFSLDTRRISPSFYSLAHEGINQDVNSQRLSALYRKKGLTVNASIEKQRDNVDKDPAKATINSQIVSTSVDYSPQNKQNATTSFWGETHFGGSVSVSKQYSSDLATQSAALNKQIQQMAVFAEFAHEKWNWNGKLSYDIIKDNTGQSANSRNQSVSLAIQREVNDTTQVSAQWQLSQEKKSGSDTLKQHLLTLGGSTQLASERLALTANLSRSETQQSHRLTEAETTLELGLTWQAKQKQDSKFKPEIWLKGQYSKQDTRLATDESYQIRTGLTITF